ncbi:MAG: ABC transporter ATP-binding protein [Flavobacteriaceae bacterium]|nr:ABC transporter ATP-binding protein [Flavobacteriaceae bacterium]
MKDQENSKSAPHIKNKHTDDLIDHYWESIRYVADLIKASEMKAGFIMTFYGILLNFIFKNLSTITDNLENLTVFYVLFSFWFVCTVMSMYYSVRCFVPRLEEKYDKNIFFFGDVISSFGSIREFSKTFYEISLDENQLFNQLGQQIYINSKIAAAKFKSIKKSIIFMIAGLALMLAFTVYYLLNTLL